MSGRRLVWFALAAAVGMGCAAIVGLSDPSDPVVDVGDAASPDVLATGDAGPDAPPGAEIGNGSGRDGPMAITDKRPVNDYAPLANRADVGARSITLGKRDPSVTTQAVKAGDVLLIVQSATPGVMTPYDTSPLDSESGAWELVAVTAVNGDVVDLARPLARAFSVPGAQVVRVAQATTVEVAEAGVITAPKWDGLTGGIIAILATEGIVLNGSIDVTGSGFRGGRAAQIPTVYACADNAGLVDAGFASRGEGFANTDAGYLGSMGGRGNAGNGGGGGDCHNSGGGGGANGGRGGVGGLSWSGDGDRAVGGLGGAALRVPSGLARLRLGGGGGAGEADDGKEGNGGQGGGVVFVRAPQLTGTGGIIARGGSGNNTTATDGAGGGGAGGTVYLDLSGALLCARIQISGGGGGNSTGSVGPGGGGGGGVAFLRDAGPDACPIDLLAGNAGLDSNVARGGAPVGDERGKPPYAGVVFGDLSP